MTDGTITDDEACCTDKTKKCCATYMFLISMLILVLAICMTAFGAVYINGAGLDQLEKGWNMHADAAFGVVCVVGAIFALIVALLGMASSRVKSAWVSCPLSIISLISGLLACAAGGGLMVGVYPDPVRTVFCNHIAGGSMASYIKLSKANLDNSMCVQGTCGCKAPSDAIKAKFTAAAKTVGRTKALSWGGENYNVYTECDAKQKLFKLAGSDDLKFWTDIEKKYNCAGFCYTPMFYMTRPITDGPPAKACDTALFTEGSKHPGSGAVALLSGFVLLTLFGASLTLCAGLSTDSNVADNGKGNEE